MDVKLIVTHINPDLDAVASVWVFKRFDEQEAGQATLGFVSAGDRISPVILEQRGLDADMVVHVDTGLGDFDHHSEALANKRVCAASLVRDYVVNKYPDIAKDEALKRIIDFVIDVDHFGDFYWPEPNNDRYLFNLDEVLHHLKTIGDTDEEVVEFGLKALDSIYAGFGVRIAAEEEIKKGIEFETVWGKALGLFTANDEVMKFAQKSGYNLIVRKDPEYGNVRIKAVPGKKIDLTQVYEKITSRDNEATWYFHPAKTMLLNGSHKKPNQVPSRLSLEEVMQIIKEVEKA